MTLTNDRVQAVYGDEVFTMDYVYDSNTLVEKRANPALADDYSNGIYVVDGSYMYAVGQGYEVNKINKTSGAVVATLPKPGNYTKILSHDNTHLYVGHEYISDLTITKVKKSNLTVVSENTLSATRGAEHFCDDDNYIYYSPGSTGATAKVNKVSKSTLALTSESSIYRNIRGMEQLNNFVYITYDDEKVSKLNKSTLSLSKTFTYGASKPYGFSFFDGLVRAGSFLNTFETVGGHISLLKFDENLNLISKSLAIDVSRAGPLITSYDGLSFMFTARMYSAREDFIIKIS